MTPYDAYRARRFFGSLDGLRAVAILAVIWHHTAPSLRFVPITARGFLGVDLFFVLSGFLIVTLLLRERNRQGEISLRAFYMRRTLRIFPVFYGMIAALSVLFFLVAPQADMAADFRAMLPFYLTYTANWVHDVTFLSITWSLAAEEQFYLVWPPLEKYLRPYVLPIIGALLVVNQLINYRVLFAAQHAELEILQSTFTPILLGVLLAHLLHNPRGFAAVYQALGRRWAAPLVAIALAVAINWPAPFTDISGTPRLLIHLLMALLLASCVAREDHVLQPVLSWRPLARLGVISYGMYLFHMLVRHVAGAVLARLPLEIPYGLLLLTLVGTIVAAELSFRFYETPFLRLKERWSSHRPAVTA